MSVYGNKRSLLTQAAYFNYPRNPAAKVVPRLLQVSWNDKYFILQLCAKSI